MSIFHAISACRPLRRAPCKLPIFGGAGTLLPERLAPLPWLETGDQCNYLLQEAAPGAAVAATATPHGRGLRAARLLPASDLLLSGEVCRAS